MNAQRLVESALPVIKRERIVHDDECPHCHELIHEKSMRWESSGPADRTGRWFHGACGGEIAPRALTDAEKKFLNALACVSKPSGGVKALQLQDGMWKLGESHQALHESPKIKTLEDTKEQLDGAEKEQAMKAGCIWNFSSKPTCAIYKSVVKGKTWYWCATHRCYQAKPTLAGAIKAYHDVVEPSA